MAEMPDPGALGDTDVAVVSMVRKVKSKLGYTEINTPVDLSQFDDEKVKFGLSEKHTKFEKIFFTVLTNQLIYLVKHEEDFFKSCVLLKKSELYDHSSPRRLPGGKNDSYNHKTTIWISHQYYLDPGFHRILWIAF